jgi:hypothetical protein
MHLDLYSRYLDKRPLATGLGKPMPYDWVNLPDTLCADWMTYSFMLDDFARELANAINGFTNNVRKLQTWGLLFQEFDAKQRREAMFEFVEPTATLCLLAPYMIRSRFVYAIAHLCHQINLVRESTWPESSLPIDTNIYMDVADRQGGPWKKYGPLKLRLESIAGKALQRATADFRNAFNHRFSARIDSGITNSVTRQLHPTTGKVRYEFGGTVPLALVEVLTLMTSELTKIYSAHDAFQTLIGTHEAFIIPHNQATLAAIDAASGCAVEVDASGRA